MVRLIAASLLLAWPAFANAHSFWFEPETHKATSKDKIKIAFKVGDIGSPPADWGLYWERIAALRLFGPSAVSDMQVSVRPTKEDAPGSATISAPGDGTHILAFASNPSFSDFGAERFNRYLEHQGLTAIAADREARGAQGTNGTELYARRAKALIQVGDTTTDNILKPIGQTLEIVPLANPFDYNSAKDLSVMVLWRGKPLAGASVMVARGGGELGTEVVVKTDAAGRTTFEYDPQARYLLSVVWGEPAPNDARADYFTIFSSVTF